MTAAPAVAPPTGPAPVKPALLPLQKGLGNDFDQVLRTARGAVAGSASVVNEVAKSAPMPKPSDRPVVETGTIVQPATAAGADPAAASKAGKAAPPASQAAGTETATSLAAAPDTVYQNTMAPEPSTGLPNETPAMRAAAEAQAPAVAPPQPHKKSKYSATIRNAAGHALAQGFSGNAAQQAAMPAAMAVLPAGAPAASLETGTSSRPQADAVLPSAVARVSPAPLPSRAAGQSLSLAAGGAMPATEPGTPNPSIVRGSVASSAPVPSRAMNRRDMQLPGGSASATMPDRPLHPPGPVSVSDGSTGPVPVQPHTASLAGAAPAAHDRGLTLQPGNVYTSQAQPAAITIALSQSMEPVASQAAMPATAAAMAPNPAFPATGAAPASQVAPALLTLGKTPGGNQQMTVLLHPADLGMVRISIARTDYGTTHVAITADNGATLLALQHDRPQLLRTLDEAGIAAAGRTVTFHAAQPAQASANSNSSASGGQQGLPNRSQNGGGDTAGSPAGGGDAHNARPPNSYATSRRQMATAGIAAANAAKTYRIGLDITA